MNEGEMGDASCSVWRTERARRSKRGRDADVLAGGTGCKGGCVSLTRRTKES